MSNASIIDCPLLQEYYPNEAAFKSGQKPYVIRLNAFFVAAVEGSTDNEFAVSSLWGQTLCKLIIAMLRVESHSCFARLKVGRFMHALPPRRSMRIPRVLFAARRTRLICKSGSAH